MTLKTRSVLDLNNLKEDITAAIPIIIGLIIAISLYLTVGWWGFWIVFPSGLSGFTSDEASIKV